MRWGKEDRGGSSSLFMQVSACPLKAGLWSWAAFRHTGSRALFSLSCLQRGHFWNYCFRSPVPLKTLPVSHLQPPVSPVPASDNFLRMKRDQLSDWSDYPFQWEQAKGTAGEVASPGAWMASFQVLPLELTCLSVCAQSSTRLSAGTDISQQQQEY